MRGFAGIAGCAAVLLVAGAAAMPAAQAATGRVQSAAGAAQAPPTAPGTTLYVAPGSSSCDDSGPGSEAEPFCTIQVAADDAQPGQTVSITDASALEEQAFTIGNSGKSTQPITFTWSGPGASPLLQGTPSTGDAVITISDAKYVTLSGFRLWADGTDDGIYIDNSSDITLDQVYVEGPLDSSSGAPSPAGINISGSSAVTISRSETAVDGVNDVGTTSGVLATDGPGLVVTTSYIRASEQSGITLDDAADAAVTNNTVEAGCDGSYTGAGNDIAVTDSSSDTIENNLLESSANSITDCVTPTAPAALSVDSESAGTVTTGYNAFFTENGSVDYDWAGTDYQHVTDFNVPGQGVNDVDLKNEVDEVPLEGSEAINSANCSAPDRLSTDILGNSWVYDPQATDADLANGSCYASRGAYAPQDSFPIAYTETPAVDPTGYIAATVSTAFGVTITSPTTSAWGEPVTYTVSFGDGSGSAFTAVPGTAVNYTYPTAGEYTVTITAADTSGLTNTTSYTVYAVPDTPVAPTLTATADGLPVEILPDRADFSYSAGADAWEVVSASLDPGSAAANGGSPGAGSAADWVYEYPQPGTYTATLTVTDVLGRTSTATTAITVGDELQSAGPLVLYNAGVAADATVKLPLSLSGPGLERSMLVNVTVSDPKKSGYIVVYPGGSAPPPLATVRFQAGQAAENSILITGSTVDFANDSAGTIDLTVTAYAIEDTSDSTSTAVGESYTPVTPAVVLPRTELAGGGHAVSFQVAGRDGVPADASAVVLDVIEAGGTSAGYLITYPAGDGPAEVHSAYWAKGQTVTNLAMVPIGGSDAVVQNNAAGAAYFAADVVGYYTSPPATSVFLPGQDQAVARVTIPAGHAVAVATAGQDAIPAATAAGATTALLVTLTSAGATASGAITGYADGTAKPPTTTLSYTAGPDIAGAAIVPLGADGAFDLYNSGSKPVTIEISLTGSYYAYS